MDDLQKLVEQWCEQLGIYRSGLELRWRTSSTPQEPPKEVQESSEFSFSNVLVERPVTMADITRLAQLAMQHAAEEAAKIVYGQCDSDNVAERTVQAIRERFKAL